MSSSVALKLLLAFAVIWAPYESSAAAVENDSSELVSNTEGTESTPPSTQLTTLADLLRSTAVEDDDSTDTTDTTMEVTEVKELNRMSFNNNESSEDKEGIRTTTSSDHQNRYMGPYNPSYSSQGLQMPYEIVHMQQNETRNEDEAYEQENQSLSPPTFSGYMYDFDSSAEGNLQDIAGQESKIVNNLYMHFESKKQKKKRIEPKLQHNQPQTVHVTSYLADSDSAVTMTEQEIINDARNKTRGADMISAFFIAPDDEVNDIDKTKYAGSPIVVSNLNEDLVRNERYSGKEASNTLTNNVLAPIQAALSLSHEEGAPVVERQVLEKQPVYKTYIEIQKSIPYEIKEIEEQKHQHENNELGAQSQISNDVVHHPTVGSEFGQHQPIFNNDLNNGYVRNQLRSPLSVYYRYPMYYLPNRYIGNYIMRHSHENTGYHQQMPVRPILPVQYVLARYQPQVYGGFLLTHPYYVTPTANVATDNAASQSQTQENIVFDSDQSGLPPEQRAQYAPPHSQHPPFRPSHPVYASQYPPYTYRVLSTMRSRSGHARTARSKQLCIEYGGFKPPMVPSVQIEDGELNEPLKDKIDSDDKATER